MAELGEDLTRIIEERLVLHVDKVRFRAVCKSWNSFLPKLPNVRVKQVPWLFHAIDSNTEASHGLFNPEDKNVYLLDLPEAKGKLFKGSSNGWVVTFDDIGPSPSPSIYLMNPLTGSRIQLPPRNKFPDVESYDSNNLNNEYGLLVPKASKIVSVLHEAMRVNRYMIDKIVWSSPPSGNDCVVVAIFGVPSKLAYCKPNDEKWTFLFRGRGIMDIEFHKGKLHALLPRGELVVFENMNPNLGFTQIATMLVPCPHYPYLYLVESLDGGLMMVGRKLRKFKPTKKDVPWFYNTCGFDVYKHDPTNLKWFRVESIGDEVIFVGYNSSISISSHEFDEYKGNRIYFCDNFSELHTVGIKGGSDIGVFNLEDKTIEPLSGFHCHPQHVWPPPLWVTPTLY